MPKGPGNCKQIVPFCSLSIFVFFLQERFYSYPMLAEVHIICVDKYQGEENEIILLSLVRSNPENNIGFLKVENRVCVALTRARRALYMIGNIENLSKSSCTWKSIRETLEMQDSIGMVGFENCFSHFLMVF